MKCSVPECDMNDEKLLCTIDDGTKRLCFCPNHLIGYGLQASSLLTRYPSEIQIFEPCEICGDTAMLLQDDEPFHLCPTHLNAIIRRDLDPQAVLKLRVKHPNGPYLTHYDLYDHEGKAINPIHIQKRDRQ